MEVTCARDAKVTRPRFRTGTPRRQVPCSKSCARHYDSCFRDSGRDRHRRPSLAVAMPAFRSRVLSAGGEPFALFLILLLRRMSLEKRSQAGMIVYMCARVFVFEVSNIPQLAILSHEFDESAHLDLQAVPIQGWLQ